MSSVNTCEKFHAYLADLDSRLAKLSELLKRKLTAVEKFDLSGLESIMKEEQAYILISNGFDKSIDEFRDMLGLDARKLGDMIEELPQDERPRFRETYRTLKVSLDEVKALNEKCQVLIEERLYSLDKAIKEIDRAAGASYGEEGKRNTNQTSLMNQSV